MRDIFTNIYRHNLWSGRQSRSGSGSDLEETKNIREQLPKVFERLGVKSVLDIPCGDFNWFECVNWPKGMSYIGGDIVPEIIFDNKQRLPYDFTVLDITQHLLPEVDLIFTRDCLGHLSDENIKKAVTNIKRNKPKYFVTTHWPTAQHKDIPDGSWRPINMEYYLDDSFELLELIEEDIKDKFLAVYVIIK